MRDDYYLMRCQHGSHRYWRAIKWKGFSCTHEELPREVANTMRIPLEHVVAFTHEPTGEITRFKGMAWESKGNLLAGRMA